jgi:hypothetical protein
MGKRDRRRKRQRAKQQVQTTDVSSAVERVLYPSHGEPLIELHFNDGVTDDAKALCRAYWEFTEPGQWARNVAEIGQAAFVSRTVRDVCRVSLLTVLCPECTAPVTVANRSEMAATGHWNEDFPLQPVDARTICQECRASARAEAEAEAALASQRAEELNKRKIESAAKQLAAALNSDEPTTYPTVRQALGLLSMAEILQQGDQESFGPLKKLKYTVTGSTKGDIDLCREMHQEGWLSPTLPAPLDAFVFDDDGNATSMYVDGVSWRFPRWLGKTASQASSAATDTLTKYLIEQVATVQDAVHRLEAGMTVDYLNGLLTDRYNEHPISEHRLPDAYETALKALQSGYLLEQMIAIAWSAAASSVAWGQRTPGLKAGAVASASVTNLERRLGFAQDRPVPLYDVPNWVARPAMHGTAIRFLTVHERAGVALASFRSLHQRINSRDELELELDLAETPSPRWDREEWLQGLREGTPAPDNSPPMTFASVTPEGELEIHEATVKAMHRTAGDMTERLPLDGTPTLDAVVPVFVDRDTHKRNAVAMRMVELLGGGFGPVNGTVVFFQTRKEGLEPQLLDGDHKQLIEAAHAAAVAETAVPPF